MTKDECLNVLLEYPRIREIIINSWGTPQVSKYINTLLTGTCNGASNRFSVVVSDALLTLNDLNSLRP